MKYFWVVCALFLVQIVCGVITAHYAVEGQELYGFALAEFLPYTISRTWHVQLALFWIATAWLATGLYMSPLLSGYEPKWQKHGVNFLFGCLLIIVVGSMAGEWLGFFQKMDLITNFWFGHQGYEYVDLGRFWQIFLFVGLLLWLVLMLRALLPALKTSANKHLIGLVALATLSIGLLYGAGLFWGRYTNIGIAEYWRWWVVHLWVEGVFEVFATALVALLFVRMGAIRGHTATLSVIFATIIFLCGGVLGTFHHLYWSGTPTSILALGSMFSAFEVVPLVLIGFEAYNHYKAEKMATWVQQFHWPLMFLLAVSFWNLVGAGLLGFLINPPIALYYMQGLNSTAAHGHAALFGVYGMLGIGLMLFCLKGLADNAAWDNRLLKWSFWCCNGGLVLMLVMSLIPMGIMQAWTSFAEGYWAARSPEMMHSPWMEFFVWARVPGDIAFGAGALLLCWFVAKVCVGNRYSIR